MTHPEDPWSHPEIARHIGVLPATVRSYRRPGHRRPAHTRGPRRRPGPFW